MTPYPFPATTVTKLITALASYVIACLRFLNHDVTSIAFTEVVFQVQVNCLVFFTFSLMLEVHTLLTKLVVAFITLEWLTFNEGNDPITVL